MEFPIIESTDVLVFGAQTAAVAAALTAKERGAAVVALSDRTYFGEETAGAMRLWPKHRSDDPLFSKVFGPGPSDPPLPAKVKRELETALLAQNIPFYFDCRPVLLLTDEPGVPGGVVVAYRSMMYAITCRVMVDASRTGVLARLAGLPMAPRALAGSRELVVVGAEPPANFDFDWSEAGAPFRVPSGDRVHDLAAYRLSIPVTSARSTFAELARADHHDRAQLFYPGIEYAADTFIDFPSHYVKGDRLYSELPDSAFSQSNDRLILVNALLPLTDERALDLNEFAEQIAIGRRGGELAAERARALPDVRVATATTLESSELGKTPSIDGIRFDAAFMRPASRTRTLHVELGAFPVLEECDVLVAGGGTGGAPAGIAAARAGAKTIVTERLHSLGGVGTLGLIAKYWFGNRVGFTEEVDRGVQALTREGAEDRSGVWNVETKMGWYLRALRDAGGAAWFGSFAFGVRMDGTAVDGVLVSTPYGAGLVRTKAAVDATGNADLAAAAGAPCRVIDARHVAVQGTGLAPRRPGRHYRNTDHTFIDDTDFKGVTHAFVNARAKFPDEFDVAPVVDSRERRQIIGEIELSPFDFLAERTFGDTVVTAMSNFDTHGFTVHPVFMVVAPDKTALSAHVPFRCLMPQGIEGLLVTGLGVSAHRDALPVIRMQADVQNQGYAAGLACATAASQGGRLRELDIRALQRRLVETGILDSDVLAHEDSFPLPQDVVREAVERGPVDLYTTAIIFAHPEQSIPLLTRQLEERGAEAEDAALILGLFGLEIAAEPLAQIVDAREWDEGWNYRGMGQFGPSMSRLDALVIALGKTQSRHAIMPLVRKVQSLDETSEFSHCRAVSVAASAIPDPRLASALYALLQRPGMQGHAHLDAAAVVAQANDDPVETEARNVSLKELILARGLYLTGDHAGLGRSILETYANDLRGHFARHAQAVLAYKEIDRLRAEVV